MTDELRNQVIVGADAEDFVTSELGKNILEIAEGDLLTAMADFAEVDVYDHEKVGEIQLRVRLARKFPQYLSELVTRGREAFATMKDPHEV